MFGEWVWYFLGGVGLFMAAYVAAALLHEGGHALAGYIFKAKCLWIRVGAWLWVPGGGIFVRIRYRAGPGECALFCPDKKSCFGAALGGPLANLATGAGAGFLWMNRGYSLWLSHPLLFVGTVSFSLGSLAMAVFNLFPAAAGAKNDGAIAVKLCRDKELYKRMRRNQQRDLLRLEFGILEEMF